MAVQLTNLTIKNLNIPFRKAFQHASATRVCTETILVTAKAGAGIMGVGEGCPRSYVTGETLDTAHAFFHANRDDLLTIHTLADLKNWIEKNSESIDKNPAAFCAIEIALLEALRTESEKTMEGLLSLPELTGSFQYTAVLGHRKLSSFKAQLQQYLEIGFTDFKVKLFGEPDIDQPNLSALRALGPDDCTIRLDANNMWADPDLAIHYIRSLDGPFTGLEEPLRARDYQGALAMYDKLGIPIILDESFTKASDFNSIDSSPSAWMLNLRISKLGGIIRTLAFAEQAHELGIPFVIGAQVGETSILTRAALTVANAYRANLFAQEGAFGTYLLDRDLINPSLMFGSGGVLWATQVEGNSKH